MHVAVALVAYRNPDDIVRCLAALERSTYTDFEIIICENGGAAAYDALVEKIADRLPGGQTVRVVSTGQNLGYAGGVNICLEQTPGADAWWVLNPDTEPHPDSMELQVDRLRRGDCEAVGCTLYLPDMRVQSYGGRWLGWLARAESMGHGDPLDEPWNPQRVEQAQAYLNGASMMIGRRFLETVGPMREDYFLYCEEVEWCLRGRRKGMRLGFAAGALVLHHQGTSTGNARDIRNKSRPPVYLNERNKLHVTRDIFPGRLPVAALAILASLFVRYGRRGAWRQLGYGIAGWAAGLRGERGIPAWMD